MPKPLAHHAKRIAHGAHRHFIPSEHNDHVPHTLKHRVLFGYSLILILVKALVLTGYIFLPAATVYSSAVTAKNIIRLTNAARHTAGLPDLSEDGQLETAAFGKAEDMVLNQYFAHTSPSGVTPWDWIKGAGYAYRYAGENLAVHYFTAEGALDGWMASPSHRKNIVDERYSEIGVGVARGVYEDFDTVFVVQMFGHPQGAQVPASMTEPEPTPEPEPAPAVAPEPTPEPEPATEPAEAEEPPVIVAAKVVPTEQEGAFEVEIEAPEAEHVTLVLGQDSAELTKDAETGRWTGEVAADPDTLDRDGENLLVRAETENGPVMEPVAVVAPRATTQELFVQEGEYRPFKLFGVFRIGNLEDAAFRFYMTMAIALGAVLLVTVFVRFEIQRHSVTFHALLVIGLSIAFALI